MVALLLAWAAMDQLHFYWASEADSLPALERAAKLNPNDSSVQTRLARAESLAGRRDASLAALQRAASISAGSLPQQEAYARGLIEAGRGADAYRQYENILGRWPRNTDARVNYGLLAQGLGYENEAIDSWQHAIDIDPGQANAQIYLAQALDRSGETQAAARHYRVYLQIVAAHKDEHHGEASVVIAAMIKIADADVAVNHQDEALRGYDAAIQFAETAKDKALESLALVHLADLQEKRGNASKAAQEYQRALAFDTVLSDPVSAGSDWFNYGQFLRRQREPERFVFACFLKAQELAGNSPGAALTAIEQARAESEVRLGHEAVAVRRTSSAIAREALELAASSFSAPR